MEIDTCTATLIMSKMGGVKVALAGRHMSKRELLRMVKALKDEYKLSIRKYRQQMNFERSQEQSKNVIKISEVIVKEINHD